MNQRKSFQGEIVIFTFSWFSTNHGKFFNCLVYIPRDSYNTELRMAIQNILVTDVDDRVLSREMRIRPVTFRTHSGDFLFAEWTHSYERVTQSFNLFGRLEVPDPPEREGTLRLE